MAESERFKPEELSVQELEELLRADFALEEGGDPARVEAALEELLRREPEGLPDVDESWARFRRERLPAERIPLRSSRRLRTLALAAVIACFLSVTAFAAAYQLWVRPGPEGPEQYRIWDSGGKQQWVTRQPNLELNFSTEPEGYDYFFVPGWLPEEPTHSSSLQNRILQGQEGSDGDYAAYGVTPEEAEGLYVYMTHEDREEGVSYQISLESPSQLYERVFVLGFEDSAAEIVQDETRDGLRQLRLTVDKARTAGETSWNEHTNYVFLYSETEGWLLRVQGTLDLESLARIAEDIRIVKSEHISHYVDTGQRMVSLDVGLG